MHLGGRLLRLVRGRGSYEWIGFDILRLEFDLKGFLY